MTTPTPLQLALEALKPFAEAAAHLHPSNPDDGTTLDGLEVRDWRRAAAAYEALSRPPAEPVEVERLGELEEVARIVDPTWVELDAELRRIDTLGDDDEKPGPQMLQEAQAQCDGRALTARAKAGAIMALINAAKATHTTPSKHEAEATIRTQAARIAEVEADRDQTTRILRQMATAITPPITDADREWAAETALSVLSTEARTPSQET